MKIFIKLVVKYRNILLFLETNMINSNFPSSFGLIGIAK